MSFLTVQAHDDGVFRFEFQSSNVRIGRSEDNDLQLDDPTVSRLHAMLEYRGRSFYVVDRGSSAGTFVNNRRVTEPTILKTGDTINIGHTTVVFGSWLAPVVEFDDSMPSSVASMTSISLDDTLADESVAGRHPARDLRAFLADVDGELMVHRPSIELYQRVLEIALKVVPFERAALMTLDEGKLVSQAQRSTEGASVGVIAFSRSIAEDAMRERQAILAQDVHSETNLIRSAMCVPLWNEREVVGILYVDSLSRPRRFTQRHLQLLTHLAHIVAIKLENKRLFDERVKARSLLDELRRAAEIQSQFLPRSAPHIDRYRLHGFNRPSFAVGGDFYNYFAFDDGRFGVVLGDVAGKGLPAALLMCSFQPLVRAVLDGSKAPDEAMTQLNRLFCHQVPGNRFITGFLGMLDPRDDVVTFCNAGQTPPLLFGTGDTVTRLEATGLPLGIIDDAGYGVNSVSLPPGSTLLIYSDGLTEIADESGEEFGEQRLLTAAQKAVGLPPEEMIDRLIRTAEEHAGDDVNEDDLTVVILQRLT